MIEPTADLIDRDSKTPAPRLTGGTRASPFGHTTPVGPVLATPDGFGAPGTDPDLEIRCEVDGRAAFLGADKETDDE
jgi:2-keto-4-pentenoate hydratase/2-oxohepta-3-ene-1,7-dioic acid hydratase in catechol pathway